MENRVNKVRTHRDLDVWKKSIDLVTLIYKHTADNPKEEMYGLTSQIRRCAVSIPSNIAEGSARTTKKDFSHFLAIALGSAAELETQLIISRNLGFLQDAVLDDLVLELTSIRRMTLGLRKSINKE
jgi:four helix bundle protein